MYTKTIIVLPFAYIVASLGAMNVVYYNYKQAKKPLNPSNK